MLENILLAAVLVVSLVTDLKAKKIPNLVTFPGILAGLTIFAYTKGWAGLVEGLLGLVLGIGLLLIPFALGGMGAGDVKLLGVVGAMKGTEFVFTSFLASAIAGGLMAIGVIAYRRQLWASIKWCGPALKTLFWRVVSRGNMRLEVAPFPAAGVGMPYGVAIAVGTLGVLIWG